MREYVVEMMKEKDYDKMMCGYMGTYKKKGIVVNAINEEKAMEEAERVMGDKWCAVDAYEYDED